MNKALPCYGPEIASCLNSYSFPGNVRELRNMIEKAMIFLKGKRLRPEDFTSQMYPGEQIVILPETRMALNRKDAERQQMLATIKECNGNQTLAAQKMGMPYSTFRRKYNRIRNDL